MCGRKTVLKYTNTFLPTLECGVFNSLLYVLKSLLLIVKPNSAVIPTQIFTCMTPGWRDSLKGANPSDPTFVPTL